MNVWNSILYHNHWFIKHDSNSLLLRVWVPCSRPNTDLKIHQDDVNCCTWDLCLLVSSCSSITWSDSLLGSLFTSYFVNISNKYTLPIKLKLWLADSSKRTSAKDILKIDRCVLRWLSVFVHLLFAYRRGILWVPLYPTLSWQAMIYLE